VDPKRKADYEKAMSRGREARTAKNQKEAIDAFTTALDAIPGDREATALLLDLLLEQGDTAMAAKRYKDAVVAFTAARKLAPKDERIRKKLDEAFTRALEQIPGGKR
jgi:tetratricopeptide (TPR) repeat protein